MIRKVFILIIVLVIGFQANATESPLRAFIKGVVTDSISGAPVEYANVSIFSLPDSTLAGGAITDSTGTFVISSLKKGNYFMKISFVGYGSMIIDNIKLGSNSEFKDLGFIKISPSSLGIEGVEIVAEKNPIEYHVDKQVINADALQNAATGTVIDILKNSPSVTVDNDDNVMLRGSTGYVLLIDGKPTVLDPKDAMRQIPASIVDQVEIITNPSAKYDAEGTAGIINILLKKKKDNGFSALVNARADNQGGYGADASFTINKNKWSIKGMLNHNMMKRKPNSENERNIIYAADSISNLYWDSNRSMENSNSSFRLGVDFNATAKNKFSVNGEVGKSKWQMGMLSDYTETSPGGDINYYTTDYLASVPGTFYNGSISYTHEFDTTASKLEITGFAMIWNGDISHTSYQYESNTDFEMLNMTQGSRNNEDALLSEYRLNVDYSDVLFKKFKLETGYQFTYRPYEAYFDAQKFDAGSWNMDSLYSTDQDFTQTKHAGYFTLSGNIKKFDVQLGLRAEDFYSEFILDSDNYDDITQDYLYWFPSLHISKKMKNMSQWQASYSRRINYPQDWMMGPTPMYSDAFMYQEGNASLLPELIDSYELSHIRFIAKKHMLSMTGFYRQTNDEIARTMYVNSDDILTVGWDNLAINRSYGFEMGSNLNISKMFSANLSASAFGLHSEGYLANTDLNYSTFSWTVRGMFNIKATPNTNIQLSGFYNAKAKEQQGIRKEQGMISMSLRQDFMKKKLSLTLNFQDIFNIFKWEYNITEPTYTTSMNFIPPYPQLSLALSYKINNYKPSQGNNDTYNPGMGM
ncbi:MAG: TonB-dependent receptor [Bacteroidales bacterium]|nr:TonB-dependent receptor [Bacteroidales bacterium]